MLVCSLPNPLQQPQRVVRGLSITLSLYVIFKVSAFPQLTLTHRFVFMMDKQLLWEMLTAPHDAGLVFNAVRFFFSLLFTCRPPSPHLSPPCPLWTGRLVPETSRSLKLHLYDVMGSMCSVWPRDERKGVIKTIYGEDLVGDDPEGMNKSWGLRIGGEAHLSRDPFKNSIHCKIYHHNSRWYWLTRWCCSCLTAGDVFSCVVLQWRHRWQRWLRGVSRPVTGTPGIPCPHLELDEKHHG